MTKNELFDILRKAIKDTDVDFQYMDGFDDFCIESELCVCFTNIQIGEIT